MSRKMPITKDKIRNHFHYSFWKYFVLILIALFGWNLIYTSTRYQSPDNLKVEFYAEAGAVGGKDLQTLADQIHTESMPEMEEVTASTITYDQTYGDMQLTVWVSAGQGDVYLLSSTRFQSLASNEALIDLQPYIDNGTLNVDGLDLSNGYYTDTDTGTKTLVGIPTDQLPGLADYGLITSDGVLCALVNNGNDAYTMKFLDYLLTHMRTSDTTEVSISASPESSSAVATVAP